MRWRSRKEERVLIADEDISRGCNYVLVVDLSGLDGLENLVMRTLR